MIPSTKPSNMYETGSSCPIPRHLAEPFNFTAFLGRVLREGKPVATENALLSPKKGTIPSLEYGRVTIHPSILHLLTTFARLKTDEPMDQSKEECALIHLVNQGGDREWLTKLPWHLSLPIWEAIRALRGRTKTCWSLGMYLLLERLDVAAQLKMTRCRLPVDPWIHNVKEVSSAFFITCPFAPVDGKPTTHRSKLKRIINKS